MCFPWSEMLSIEFIRYLAARNRAKKLLKAALDCKPHLNIG